MKWTHVTENDANTVTPADAIPFVLTPHERDVAIVAKMQLERHRRNENERDAKRQLRENGNGI